MPILNSLVQDPLWASLSKMAVLGEHISMCPHRLRDVEDWWYKLTASKSMSEPGGLN